MSAEERRESVIRAAVTEFSRGGYHGTSTEAIAQRVGVSQPYLFRLFPNKQAMFLAAAERCLAVVIEVLAAGAKDVPAEDAREAMALAYSKLIEDNPEMLLMQLQTYVAVAAAEAAGDHDFGKPIRAQWSEMWDESVLALGGDLRLTTDFVGCGMLVNVLTALRFPADHRVWSGFEEAPG